MGQVTSANIDNTNGTTSIVANKLKYCQSDKIIVFNEQNNVSIQYINTHDTNESEPNERSYMGEISGNYNVRANISVRESQQITVELRYTLVDYIEDNSQIERHHGLGHLIFRSVENRKCTSVQLCIDSINISSEGLIVATYIGYLEKDFKITTDCIDGTNIDLCVTFMLTF